MKETKRTKTFIKRTLACVMAVVMVLTIAPLGGFVGLELGLSASAASHYVGDIIEFGTYPQSEVTDSATLSALNKLELDWISYGYYSGTGISLNDGVGSMVSGDWMKYADVTYNGEKYRCVNFTQYRPSASTTASSADNSYQYDNGYYINTNYWFKFEPIKWRVLDPSTGLLMSETLIDSQPYSNIVYEDDNFDYYNNTEKTIYANDYATSSIRAWLNDDFYNTAFTDSQKDQIYATELDNNAAINDKIFLLSFSEVTNSDYGFSSSGTFLDTAREAKSSDYAKCQGLRVFSDDRFSWWIGNSEWRLRTPGGRSYRACYVYEDGEAVDDMLTVNFNAGIRPAIITKPNDQSSDQPTGNIVDSGECGVNGDNVTWTLDSEGTLTISGEGEMQDYDWNGSPFYENKSIKKIVIEDGVATIGNNAFRDCDSLTSVTIPDSVTSIGDLAFNSCDGLISVTIPDSITAIGYEAFQYCGLESVTIGNSVITIDDYAFYGCRSLKSITIPDSVTSIGERVFERCYDLEFVTIGNNLATIGGNAFFDTALYNNDANWENGVLYISKYLIKAESFFSGSYAIKDGTKVIADQAFWNCEGLESIMIPDSVTDIGEWAFYRCDSLTSITIPDGVTDIGDYAFYECSSLTSLTIPNSVTIIGDSTFEYCSSLETITIPNSVKSIGDSAFKYCSGLENVTIGNGVTTIGDETFYACTSLERITIGNSVTTIGNEAFSWCVSLISVTIPDSVISIGDSAFEWCSELESVTIGNGVTKIGNEAFSECESLTSVTIPDSVTSIGNWAFDYCSNLASVVIGNSITTIGTATFQGCSSLASITIPNSVTSIGDYAFAFCDSLLDITIPDSVTTIGEKTFYYCTALKCVIIPKSVTSIGWYAFEDCFRLTDVYYAGTQEQWNAINIDPSNFYLLNATIHYNYVPHTHTYTSTVTKAATCTATGVKTYTCTICDDSYTESIPALGHNYSTAWTTDKVATCTAEGSKSHHCTRCDAKTDVTTIAKIAHKTKTTTTKATTSKDGKTVTACTVCGTTTKTVTIAKVSTIKLSATSYTYDGKAKKPTVTVKDSNGKALKSGTDYSVSYASGRKNIGSYTVKVTLKGNYSGTKTLTFKIVPAKVTSLKASSQTTKSITLSWKKVSGAAGYVVYKYDSAKKAYVKVKTTKETTYKVTDLKAGTTYKFKVRAYKKVDGSNVYGAYSAVLSTATKTAAPKITVTAGSKKATLNWKKISGATGYQVYMATSKDGKYKKVGTVKKAATVKYTAKDLTKGKTYYFKVRAYKTVDGKNIYSGYSSVKSVKIK